ncbi:zinc finger domain-containing protein, partial [Rhizobium ruizarguesonis]
IIDGEGMLEIAERSVYDRESQACRTTGCGGTVARIVQAGRSTLYCATCQK